MSRTEVDSYRKRLDDLFKKVALLQAEPELQAHWARYLCVLVSGFLEVSVHSIYGDYARKVSHSNVGSYVQSELGQFQNPKMEKICVLTRQFSVSWEVQLRRDTEGELKDAVDSVVANRHAIAHGRSVEITYQRMFEYYQRVLKVVDLLDKQCV